MKAVNCFTKAIKAAPDNETLYANRAATLCQLNKFTKALQDADKSLSLKPEWPKGQYRRAQALVGLERGSEALEALEAAALGDDAMSRNDEYRQLLRKAHLLTSNVISTEDDYDASEVRADGSTTQTPAEFGKEVMNAVITAFNAEDKTDPCAYFPEGTVVGIGKAFEGRNELLQCAGFLRSHALKTGSSMVALVVQRTDVQYPKVWEHQVWDGRKVPLTRTLTRTLTHQVWDGRKVPKNKWKFKGQDGVFIQLDTDTVENNRVWFLPLRNGKLQESVMLDEVHMALMPGIFIDPEDGVAVFDKVEKIAEHIVAAMPQAQTD